MDFYDRVAAAMDLDPAQLFYDCTKISVSENIQSNIFAALDALSSDKSYTGMMWAASGPKTDHTLPDDTVELNSGFLCYGQEKNLCRSM